MHQFEDAVDAVLLIAEPPPHFASHLKDMSMSAATQGSIEAAIGFTRRIPDYRHRNFVRLNVESVLSKQARPVKAARYVLHTNGTPSRDFTSIAMALATVPAPSTRIDESTSRLHFAVKPNFTEEEANLAKQCLETFSEFTDVDLLNQNAWKTVSRSDATPDVYTKALRQIQQAVELQPSSAAYQNTLGVAWYRMGEWNEAKATLTRSARLNATEPGGSSPVDMVFLAMANQHLGNTELAREQLQQVSQLSRERRWIRNAELRRFIKEAEALIGSEVIAGQSDTSGAKAATSDSLTVWMTRKELEQRLSQQKSKGLWMSVLEGRWHEGTAQYRIQEIPRPVGQPYWWYRWFDMDKDVFDQRKDKFKKDGFRLVHSSSFAKPDGSVRYQAIWQKVGKPAGPEKK